jgi:hypothetical protein
VTYLQILRLGVSLSLSLVLLGPAALAQNEPPAFLVGKWLVSSVATGDQVTSITLSEDGRYQGGAWGRCPGGPNGLGATRYQYRGGILTFFYPHEGRRGPDNMLEGTLQRDPAVQNQYIFAVTGGYYGGCGGNYRLKKIGEL